MTKRSHEMKDGDWVDAMERKKRIGMKKKAEVTVEERIEILQNMIKGLEKKLDSKFESIPEVELTNKGLRHWRHVLSGGERYAKMISSFTNI